MSNAFDKASLVMLPHAYEEGKLYSLKPTDRSGDFTFSRGTDTATRVNASGNIEKETQNLLLQSNQFDTTWLVNGVSVTSGQVGYDGTNDAWLLERVDGLARFLYQLISTTSVATFSVYVKAGNTDWVYLNTINTTAYFDLTNGVIGSVTGGDRIDTNIESVGNGWYRISITGNGIDGVRIYPAIGNGVISGASGLNILIQDAQLNQGLIAQEVITTTTTAIYGGITDNVPRLDYTDSSCPALLLEPQRTNLVTQSEYFGDSVWSKQGGISVAANNAISPSGYTDASKIELTATDGKIQYQTTGLSGTYTFSVFAKKGNHNFVYIFIARPSGNITRWINLDNGSITNGTGTAEVSTENYGDDWYKIIYTFEGDAAYTNFTIEVADNNSSSGTIGDNIYIYGAQAELGSYATSYIPTYGSAVTRNRGFCYDAGNAATFNSTEGVFYFEGSALADDGTNRFLSLSDGTPNNYIYFRYVSTSNQYLFRTQIGGVTINTLSAYLADTTENHKFAFKFKSGDYAMWVDGVEISTDTSSTIFAPNVLSNMEFSFPTDGGGGFPSKTKQIMVFNTALTDEELATLTTI